MEIRVKDYLDLPLSLTVEEVARVLGISRASAYNLVHRDDFPTVSIGRRLVIPRDLFFGWIEKEAQG